MGWTKRSYDILFEWPNKSKRPTVKNLLLKDGLVDTVARLEKAENLGEWYRIVQEAVAAVGPGIVEGSANEAEVSLAKMAATMGRKGGLAKTRRKAAAARENGRLGGRPRKL